MKSLALATLVFLALAFAQNARANGPENPCEESARVVALSHMVEKYGDDFVNSLYGPYSFYTKDWDGREVILVTFHTGAHDTEDVVTYGVDVVTVDSKRAASKVHRCVIYSVRDFVLHHDNR